MALRGGGDEDEAPWLSAAEPDGRETYVSRRRFRITAILLGALVLVVAALLYAVIAKPQAHDDETGFAGDVPLIRAPEGPFRTRPENAGGMDVEGVGQTAYQAADGVDPEGQLALDQIPEEPMERPVAPKAEPRHQVMPERPQATQAAPPPGVRVQPTPTAPPEPPRPSAPAPKKAELPEVKIPRPAAAPPPKVVETPKKPSSDRLADVLADVDKAAAKAPKKVEADMPAVTSGGSGPAALQLGAFSSSAKADAAWKNFQHYSYIAGLTKSVVKVDREEGGAVYRLKATGVETREKAANLCARLKVAGEQCVVSQ